MESSNRRQEFLSRVWKSLAYPTAHSKGASLRSSYAHDEPFITHGRLVKHLPSSLVLGAQGVHTEFTVKDGLEMATDFPWSHSLIVGDIIEVEGVGRRGLPEITSIKLLVPSEGQNPFGLTKFDENRGRQWQKFMQLLRNFFVTRDFVELRTPTLVPSPGLEPHLDPFETELILGSTKKTFYLPTSPEFHLKKALTLGFERCFEFKECFRNGELSAHHQPEFLMLEWYRAFADNSALITDLRELFRFLFKEMGRSHLDIAVITMEELWERELNFKLTPQASLEELQAVARKAAVEFDLDENFDDLFARIFLEKLENQLAKRPEPTIVYHYPPSQAALARLTSEGWADRFELYWGGFEIANAFHELNDSEEQLRRFKKDQEQKKQLGKKVVPIDEEFLQALRWGMPPSAGIALGVERLFMAFHGVENLEDIRLFPMRVD